MCLFVAFFLASVTVSLSFQLPVYRLNVVLPPIVKYQSQFRLHDSTTDGSNAFDFSSIGQVFVTNIVRAVVIGSVFDVIFSGMVTFKALVEESGNVKYKEILGKIDAKFDAFRKDLDGS